MKIFEEILKVVVVSVVILLFVFVCLFIHDVWIDINHSKSEKLFFPKLFENDCFNQAFDRDIKDEKIIAFDCWAEMWGGNQWRYEIITFCDERCFSSTEIFKHSTGQESIKELEKFFSLDDNDKFIFLKSEFYFFKKTLENEYYRKYQKPFAEAIISHSIYYDSWAWYDHNSKICWYVNEGGR